MCLCAGRNWFRCCIGSAIEIAIEMEMKIFDVAAADIVVAVVDVVVVDVVAVVVADEL